MTATQRPRGRPRTSAGSEGATIQALDRAMDVLDMLAGEQGLSLTEISSRLDQSPSTIYRVLVTLEARRMIEIDPISQNWHIGSGAFRIGSAFLRRSNIVERSRSTMRMLVDETGETANLGIENDGTVIFVSQIETQQSIRAFFPPGSRSPLHVSGIGKALLASLPEDRLDRILSQIDFRQLTPNTITDPQSLRRALAEVRARGYSVDDEEHTIGMRCIAAPILNHYSEPIAGISVSGPVHRVAGNQIALIGDAVARAASELSRNLGAPESGA